MAEKIPVDSNKQRLLVAYVPALDDTVLVKATPDGSLALALTDEENKLNADDIDSIDWNGTALTAAEIQSFLDGGLAKALPDTKKITINFVRPIFTAEFETYLATLEAIDGSDLKRTYTLIDTSTVIEITGLTADVNDKIVKVVLENTSGGALTIDLFLLKKYTTVNIMSEVGHPLYTNKIITLVKDMTITLANPDANFDATFNMVRDKLKIKRMLLVRTAKVGTAYNVNTLRVLLRDAQFALTGHQHTLYLEETAEPDTNEVVFNRTTYDIGEVLFDPLGVDALATGKLYINLQRAGGDGTSSETYQLIVQGEESE